METIVAQIIGFIALAISMLAFQNSKRTTILYINGVACILFGIHYFLLGGWTGAVVNLLVGLRNYIYAQKGIKSWANDDRWLYLFILIFITSSLMSWQGIITLLPLTSVILGTTIFWMNNTRYIRMLSLFSPPMWFVYNFITNSYPGMIGDTLTFISIIIAIVRFDILNKNKLSKEICE